uniref:Fucosyltransferase n=1 Tax=Zea mays TaxID=4577 RepID=A0A804LPJ6_MAIZE
MALGCQLRAPPCFSAPARPPSPHPLPDARPRLPLSSGGWCAQASGSGSPRASWRCVGRRRRWRCWLPLLVGVAFLGLLDMAKNVEVVESCTTSFYRCSSHGGEAVGRGAVPWSGDDGEGEETRRCEQRSEREDAMPYDRDVDMDAVLVGGAAKDWNPSIEGILRSMESSQYYSKNSINVARGRGYKIVITISLSSDFPVGNSSWAEYDAVAPVPPKTEEALAAAFISNCCARNFRLQALEMLENLDVKIDSYGGCHRNRDGKVDTLKRYKFSLAFENSNEEDYVTEEFFPNHW